MELLLLFMLALQLIESSIGSKDGKSKLVSSMFRMLKK